MNHERFDELKNAFVLGALPEEERREVEEYLAAHPERQTEIDELGAVAGLLALSPQEQEPPPQLRRSIMNVVEAEAERPRAEPSSGLARIREFLDVRNLVLGAAALLVIGLFSWNVLLQGQIQDLQDQAQSPQAPQVVVLEGSGAARQAKAEVMVLHNDQAVLMADDMPPVPEDRTCQIWVIENDVPKPSGLFEPKEGPIAVVVENSVERGDTIAVTLEPEGGSRKPTTDPMLAAEL
jgi:anti-sigma-K factor RskA